MHIQCAPKGLQTGLASGTISCLSHNAKRDFMDDIVNKICEQRGLNKNVVNEIINCDSIKDEKRRLKRIDSLLEKL